ncbi:hypothetical protein [Pseudophaeobacter sp.]|uniref:hypothetical protein n=1 Tax=Pseudophaeobacter sp. TaxID=1971739 RepID=UPI003296D225
MRNLTPPPVSRPAAPLPPRDWLWSDAADYDGLFWPGLNLETGSDRLESWLLRDLQLWQSEHGLIAIFQIPQWLTPDEFGVAYPLKKMRSGGFGSYVDATPSRDEIQIYSSGRVQFLDLKAARQVDVAALWQVRITAIETARPLAVLSKPKPPLTPAIENVLLDEVMDDDPMDDIRTVVNNAADETPYERIARRIPEIKHKTTILFLWLLLLAGGFGCFVLVLMLLSPPETTSGNIVSDASDPAPFLVTLVGVLLIGALFMAVLSNLPTRRGAQRVVGPASSSTARPGSAQTNSHSGQSPKSGLGSRLKGWLMWNSGAGNKLRRQLEQRLAETERLLRDGQVDAALKRALAMGANSNEPPKGLATRLPEIRGNLDLKLSRTSGGSSFLMGSDGFDGVVNRYRQLANDLEKDRDFKRAAFVLSDLLNDDHGALQVLKRGELFEEAAKFAAGHNMDVKEIAVLWYLAGKRDIAVLMAQRHDSMKELVSAAESRNKNAGLFFRAVWADHLVAHKDFRQALQITDRVKALEAQRLPWLADAFADGQANDPEIMHRAIIVLPWNKAALEPNHLPDPSQIGGQIEGYLRESLENPQKSAEILHFVTKAHQEKHVGQSEFLSSRGRVLVDQLVRVVIAAGIPIDQSDLKSWGKLAKAIGLVVLAEDLKMIRRKGLPSPGREKRLVRLSPQPKDNWRHIAHGGHNRLMAASGDGKLAVLRMDGHVEWSDFVPRIEGLVRIHRGRYVLIVVQGRESEKRIIRFDTVRKTHLEIGSLPLEAWDHSTTDQLWMVFCNGRIQALNVALLLGEIPGFEELWGTTIKEPVKILGFQTEGHSIGWFMQRDDGERLGVIEQWTAPKSTLAFTAWLIEYLRPEGGVRFSSDYQSQIYCKTIGYENYRFYNPLQADVTAVNIDLTRVEYSWDEEERISRDIDADGGLRNTASIFFSPRGCRISIPDPDDSGEISIQVQKAPRSPTVFRAKGFSLTRVEAAPDSNIILLLSSEGWLLSINKDTLEVTEIS